MATTRADLRSTCRTELGDTTAPYVWSDAQLNTYIADAVREMTFIDPLPAATVVAMVADQRGYVLGSDVYKPLRVEWPVGTFVERDQEGVPGYAAAGDVRDGGWAQAWTYDPATRTLVVRNPPTSAGKSFRVHYYRHRTPVADDVSAQPVEDEDAAMVALLACRAAWDGRRLEDAKRGLRTPGGQNPFAGRVERMIARRRRAVRET